MQLSATGVYQQRGTMYIWTVVTEVTEVTEVTVETVVTVVTVVAEVTGFTVMEVGLVVTVVKIVTSNDCNGISDSIDCSASCDRSVTGVT